MDGRRPASAGAQNPAYRPARPPPELTETWLCGWAPMTMAAARRHLLSRIMLHFSPFLWPGLCLRTAVAAVANVGPFVWSADAGRLLRSPLAGQHGGFIDLNQTSYLPTLDPQAAREEHSAYRACVGVARYLKKIAGLPFSSPKSGVEWRVYFRLLNHSLNVDEIPCMVPVPSRPHG
jgi:hypothetical protein